MTPAFIKPSQRMKWRKERLAKGRGVELTASERMRAARGSAGSAESSRNILLVNKEISATLAAVQRLSGFGGNFTEVLRAVKAHEAPPNTDPDIPL